MKDINENAQSSATQCAMIKAYLEEGHTLTSLEALRLFGCMRLASRICDLRDLGMNIGKNTIVLPNKKRVCEYYLVTK